MLPPEDADDQLFEQPTTVRSQSTEQANGGASMQETPTTTHSAGLSSNVAGALAYSLGVLTGILFYLLQKDDRFVRFHAMQSILVSVAYIVAAIGLTILETALAFVPVLGWIVGGVLAMALSLGGFVLWVLLMVRAFQGRQWEAPLVGQYARRHSAS